jgi:Cu/Ag efflux protein CusF
MTRRCFVIAIGVLALAAASLPAQEGPKRGKIKKIDTTGDTLVITAGDKDVTVVVTGKTRMVGADNQDLAGRLKSAELKEGIAVMFLAREQDGKNVLIGLKIAGQGGPASPQGRGGDIQRGKIKKLDLDAMTIILIQGDKDRRVDLTEKTQVLDAQGATLQEKLKGFKDGAEVFFKLGQRDGKTVLEGIKLAGPGGGPGGRLVKVDTSAFKPLTEMTGSSAKYHGFEGGLYGGGKNERPKEHEAAGLALARQVQPLDADGKPSADGKIVMMSVGMSNTAQASSGFQQALAKDKDVNPRMLFVNGAVGGMTALAIQDPDDNGRGTRYWAEVDQRLRQAGVTRAQVQVIWIKEADAGPNSGFPTYAKTLQAELTRIVQIFPNRFPNCKLVYLSSRTYGGYATTALNPEPYAFESGFSVQWLIAEQIKRDANLNFDAAKGAVKAPWLSWGPYLWANGSTKRSDGYSYERSDFAGDGTHHSAEGSRKIGQHMLAFFKRDSTAKPWFVRN